MRRKRLDRLGDEGQLFRHYSYNQHFVCLACRKMFNQLPWFRRHDAPAKTFKVICPECGAEMKNAGRGFKPPRRNNIKQWRKVDLLLQRGYRWDYTRVERHEVTEGLPKGVVRRCHVIHILNGPRARTLREAKEDYPPKG